MSTRRSCPAARPCPPYAIGHECVAEVVETGAGVTHIEAGDLVVVPWHIACGRCDRCHAGLFAHCRSVPHMAMYGAPIGGDWGGLFSDLVRVPYADAMIVALPPGVDPIAVASAGRWPGDSSLRTSPRGPEARC